MPRTYTFEDSPRISTGEIAGKGDGRHRLDFHLDGAAVYAVVKDGKLASFEAEREGSPVETLVVRETKSNLQAEAVPVKAWICACSGDSCVCREIEVISG
ncbi:hypothetical protein GCM10012320_18600 [Sinomonas cellulolyticus]|jgi:hypothetical protein|uniref:Uncharacterized protein n=1 Tax=Sinomonas cellulolyticus TaxID=2801916 RepID=A0ABS1K6H5_9MICC|nr:MULTISPECIES: hypothetical protein [Sinomonas]MBL0707240.1 hypothetical protein [Sinomonas cellulolyticus]GHG50200.1 hypothetical protein GCM10012320_18600 [Sinomonas sp. KCTC 49339]